MEELQLGFFISFFIWNSGWVQSYGIAGSKLLLVNYQVVNLVVNYRLLVVNYQYPFSATR